MVNEGEVLVRFPAVAEHIKRKLLKKGFRELLEWRALLVNSRAFKLVLREPDKEIVRYLRKNLGVRRPERAACAYIIRFHGLEGGVTRINGSFIALASGSVIPYVPAWIRRLGTIHAP